MKIKVVTTPAEGESKARPKSGVGFPYFDLEQSIRVAADIHTKGGNACSSDQIAAWLGYQNVKSGTFLTRLAAARQFGLIAGQGERITVTERALQILAPVMPSDAEAAKAEAFLDVDLFSRIYEQFKGSVLPPEIGLKNLFANTFKIVPDRVQVAIRTFLNSAEQAGFFSTTGDASRLIHPVKMGSGSRAAAPAAIPPATTPDEPPAPVSEKPKVGGGGGGGGGGGDGRGDGPSGVHSAIVGLLRDLPPAGSHWSSAKKARFLAAFQATIDFVYPPEDDS